MLKRANRRKEEAVIAVETRDHLSNGVSPKDQRSRGNQLKTFFVIFLCSIFAVTTFNSCDKSKKMDGTNWEGDCDFVAPYDNEVKFSGTISISFAGDAADIVAKFKVKDIYLDDTWNETYKGTATYTLDKKNINIKVKWKDDGVDNIDDGKWTGTIDKTTMTLRNVFGETVNFKKQ